MPLQAAGHLQSSHAATTLAPATRHPPPYCSHNRSPPPATVLQLCTAVPVPRLLHPRSPQSALREQALPASVLGRHPCCRSPPPKHNPGRRGFSEEMELIMLQMNLKNCENLVAFDSATLVEEGGQNNATYGGRVILIKWGDYTRKIGNDASAETIKEAIKSAFGLRIRRTFWLEDQDDVVRSLDREMPMGTYTLHLDEVGQTHAKSGWRYRRRCSYNTKENI